MFVYKITNTVNGKMYIGITTNAVNLRWNQHKCIAFTAKSNYPLYLAMRKYGWAAFRISVMYEAVDELELKAVERGLIAQYGTMVRAGGYNQTVGGSTDEGMLHPIGVAHSKSKLTEEVIKFIRNDAQRKLATAALVVLVKEKFGVKISRNSLHSARCGLTWQHMDKLYPPVVFAQGEGQARSSAAVKLAGMGKRRAAKLNAQQVREIFADPRGCIDVSRVYGISHASVSNIRSKKTWIAETEGLTPRVNLH